MNRRLLAVLVSGTLAAAPTVLSAQSASLVIAGGLSIPVSDLSNTNNSGYNVAAGLNFGAPIIPVGARIELGYNGFDSKSGGGANSRIISGTANAILNLGPTSAAPYLIGGLGIYNRHINTNSVLTIDDKTVAGVNLGGGIRFPLGGISTFLEARYHVMLGNKNDLTNYQYIPITFGISF
jgi:opacity protein-like surface antigen